MLQSICLGSRERSQRLSLAGRAASIRPSVAHSRDLNSAVGHVRLTKSPTSTNDGPGSALCNARDDSLWGVQWNRGGVSALRIAISLGGQSTRSFQLDCPEPKWC